MSDGLLNRTDFVEMDYWAISADDHIDLGYLPKDLWLDRLPSKLRPLAPHVEEREAGDLWVCAGDVWGEYRGERWFSRRGRIPHRPRSRRRR